VLLSFNSSLSFKRCIAADDCVYGYFCAGKHMQSGVADWAGCDPLGANFDCPIPIGTCYPCGARWDDGLEFPRLLEVVCPNTTSLQCLPACVAGCSSTVNPQMYLSEFSAADQACTSSCAESCYGALVEPARSAVRDVMGSLDGWEKYKEWRTILEECGDCTGSKRTGRTYMTAVELELVNTVRMTTFDFIALALAAMIVALIATRELRDIAVGDVMTRQLVAKMLANELEGSDGPGGEFIRKYHTPLRWGIGFGVGARRYIIVPQTLHTVVLLVLRLGGDTVSVMLNTLATLFMLELDNLAFDYGLSVRSRNTISGMWSVRLGPVQHSLLSLLRRWNVCSFCSAIFLIVFGISKGWFESIQTVRDRELMIGLVFVTLIAGGEILELIHLTPRRSAAQNRERWGIMLFKVAGAVGVNAVTLNKMYAFSRS